MDVATERQDDILSVLVSGRIDGSNVMQFEETVRTAIEESDHAVVMDFERLAYISSASLRAVLLIAKSLSGQGAGLALCAMSDQIRDVFEVSGFDRFIPIHPSRAEALSSFDA